MLKLPQVAPVSGQSGAVRWWPLPTLRTCRSVKLATPAVAALLVELSLVRLALGLDRESVVEGKSVDLGGGRSLQKKAGWEVIGAAVEAPVGKAAVGATRPQRER